MLHRRNYGQFFFKGIILRSNDSPDHDIERGDLKGQYARKVPCIKLRIYNHGYFGLSAAILWVTGVSRSLCGHHSLLFIGRTFPCIRHNKDLGPVWNGAERFWVGFVALINFKIGLVLVSNVLVGRKR